MTTYKAGDKGFSEDDFKKLDPFPQPGRIVAFDPMLDVLGALSANIAALALAIDAYTQLRKKETTNNV